MQKNTGNLMYLLKTKKLMRFDWVTIAWASKD